jgi:hypothetical protein
MSLSARFTLESGHWQRKMKYLLWANSDWNSAARQTTKIQSSVQWSWGKAVYPDVIAGIVALNDGMAGRIRAVEKLMWFDFIVPATDRDMPFPLLYVSIVNRVGIATVAASPAPAVALLREPFAVRRVSVFWFPAPLGLLHESYISDRQLSDRKTETNSFLHVLKLIALSFWQLPSPNLFLNRGSLPRSWRFCQHTWRI